MKILALNVMEEKKKRIMERVIAKYSDKDRVPTAYERFIWLVNFLFPYFKTFKIIMTVITPSKLPLLLIIYSSDSYLVRQEFQTRFEKITQRVQYGWPWKWIKANERFGV